jgi:hypothetical protein
VAAAPLAVLAGLIVPQPGEQATPFCVNVQVTPLLVASYITVAVNKLEAFNETPAVGGETETEICTRPIRALAAYPPLLVATKKMEVKRAPDGNWYGVSGAV